MTYEESIEIDRERVQFIDHIMSKLGFRQHLPHESRQGPYKFTDLILYRDKSGDSVSVFFPYADQVEQGLEMTTQAKFNNTIKSPEWESLYQFEDEIGSWMEECRRRNNTK